MSMIPQNLTDEQVLAQIESSKALRKFLFPALVLKLRYRLWLVALREISILSSLIRNYEKIPNRSFSKTLIRLFVKHSFLRNLLLKVESRLRKRIY